MSATTSMPATVVNRSGRPAGPAARRAQTAEAAAQQAAGGAAGRLAADAPCFIEIEIKASAGPSWLGAPPDPGGRVGGRTEQACTARLTVRLAAQTVRFDGPELLFLSGERIVRSVPRADIASLTWQPADPRRRPAGAKHPNAGAFWDDEERSRLTEEVLGDLSWSEISRRHGRTVTAVRREAVKARLVDELGRRLDRPVAPDRATGPDQAMRGGIGGETGTGIGAGSERAAKAEAGDGAADAAAGNGAGRGVGSGAAVGGSSEGAASGSAMGPDRATDGRATSAGGDAASAQTGGTRADRLVGATAGADAAGCAEGDEAGGKSGGESRGAAGASAAPSGQGVSGPTGIPGRGRSGLSGTPGLSGGSRPGRDGSAAGLGRLSGFDSIPRQRG